MHNIFQNTADFYDIDQHPADHDDVPFYIQKAIEFGSPILELACGTGRVAIPLAIEGISVYGLDISRKMLSIFEKKCRELPRDISEKITIRQGEMSDFSFATSFKLILIPFHSFQALPSDEEALKCLDCVYHHLDDDDALILNVARFNDEFVRNWKEGLETQESTRILEDGQWMSRYTIFQELDQQKRLMNFDNLYRISSVEAAAKEYRDRLQIRYYEADDLRQLLHQAGFEITEKMGWYDGTPLEDGDEMIFVCKKRARI